MRLGGPCDGVHEDIRCGEWLVQAVRDGIAATVGENQPTLRMVAVPLR